MITPAHILIVDDNPAQLTALSAALSDMNIQIIIASSGTEALRKLLKQDFAVILLDVRMPVMDGFETATLIRSRSRSEFLPIIFVTSEALDNDSRLKGYELGAVDYILSPILPQILRAKVATFVELYRLRQTSSCCAQILTEKNAEISRHNLALRQSEERYRLLVDGVKDCANIMLDKDGNIVTWNPNAERIKGYTAAEIIGRHFSLFYPEDEVVADRPKAILAQALLQGHFEDEGWRVRKDGSQFWAHVFITPLYNEKNELLGFSKVTSDFTERKQTEEKLQQLAHHDPLTGLPNRTLFYDRLTQGLAQAQRYQQEMAVLFLDLDHFKEINDSLGHDAGDELLKETAIRLLACVRKMDTVARMGGDEFTVIINDMKMPENAERVAMKILKALLEPFDLNETLCNIGCSIGIASYPKHGGNSETLLKNADTAMYQAKIKRNTYCIYSHDRLPT